MTGVPENQVYAATKAMADNRPGTFIWCMGGTQHTIGNNNTRAYCASPAGSATWALAGGGTNIFRGHDNVQGATDFGVLSHTLPGYYGLAEGSWKHWAKSGILTMNGWQRVSTRRLLRRREVAPTKIVNAATLMGIPVSRWIDGVLEEDPYSPAATICAP